MLESPPSHPKRRPLIDTPTPAPLLTAIFGDLAPAISSICYRLQTWSDAFTDWLAGIDARHGPTATHQCLHAWTSLLTFHRCLPWQLDAPRLEAWLAHLVETGCTHNTIRCYRSRISGFYRYCAQQPLMRLDPLFAAYFAANLTGSKFVNPFRLVPTPRPPANYQNAYILRPPEARALLRAVDRRASLLGQRDYAFLLTLLLTALPETEVRCLQWQEIDFAVEAPNGLESSIAKKELPPAALAAIHHHLHASGRLPTIQPTDYIFAPLADPLLRPPTSDPTAWLPTRPISQEQALVALKNYAAWAGLDAAQVTFAALRHTAAALRLECGDDSAALQRLLTRSSLQDTRRYIDHLSRLLQSRGRGRRPWAGRKPHTFHRRERGAQPGNTNALKHGFYYRRWLPEDTQDVDLDQLHSTQLQNEIEALRLLMIRLVRLTGQKDDPATAAKALQLFSLATTRLAQLVQKQQQNISSDKHAILQAATSLALQEIYKDFGWIDENGHPKT